jgi:hypothetical protein
LYKEKKLSYVGTVSNLKDLLIAFNGIPEDGQYATTCCSVGINNCSISIKCPLSNVLSD